MLFCFLTFSCFLIWNTGERTIETTETVELSDGLSKEEAISIMGDRDTDFFLDDRKGDTYAHFTEIKIEKTKSFIPMVYINEIAKESQSFLRRQGNQ